MSLLSTYSFAPDFAALIAPLPEEDPTGASLRYSSAYLKIREARLEDDHTLDMGEWSRPLKKADWHAMEALCIQVLQTESKDLQVAAWLTEAWVRRHGLEGLRAGTELMTALCRTFWDGVHPRIDEGDVDLRVAPFVWACDTLSQAVLLHVPLIPWIDNSPPFLSLYDWQRVLAAEFSVGAARDRHSSVAITREEVFGESVRHAHALVALDEAAAQAALAWDALTVCLDEQLGDASPSLAKVAENIKQLRLAVRSLLQEHDPRRSTALPDAASSVETLPFEPFVEMPVMDHPALPVQTEGVVDAAPGLPAVPAHVNSRAEAYRLLELAAAYLEKTEPHSPTPYLIKRAITWGRLPLPELMREVIQEEGDISRYFSLLGIKSM